MYQSPTLSHYYCSGFLRSDLIDDIIYNSLPVILVRHIFSLPIITCFLCCFLFFSDRTEVYNKLKNCNSHMNVYLKEDIPNRFYYQHNDRIQPIILVANEGWTIVLNKSSQKCKYLVEIFLLYSRNKSCLVIPLC